MSVTTEIQRIKTNISNAYTAIESKGGIVSGDKNSENLATSINSIAGGGNKLGVGIDNFIGENYSGFLTKPDSLTLNLDGIDQIGFASMAGMWAGRIDFETDTLILPDVETIEADGLRAACIATENLYNINMPNVGMIDEYGMAYVATFSQVEHVHLPNLIHAGNYAFFNAFRDSNLEIFNASNLQEIYSCTFDSAFINCGGISSLDFSSVASTDAYAFSNAFSGSGLETIDFRNLGVPGSSQVSTITFGSVPSIYAFNGAQNLQKIIFSEKSRAKIEAIRGYDEKWGAPSSCEIEFI